jgi:HlyD family secretion protein
MKKKTIFGAIAVILIAAVIFVVVQNNSQNTKGVSVRTGEVKTETITEKLSTTGTLIPTDEQSLMGTGTVTEVKVSVGDKVEKGQVLATYDSGLQLTAGIKGTVTEVNIKAGQPDINAQAGKASLKIDDLSTLKVQLQLANSEASAISVDQKAEIIANDQTFAGKVTEKDPVAIATQSATGTSASLGAIVTFDKAPETLYAGFDVDVDIITNTANDVIALPLEALTYTDNNDPIVYVVKDNQAKETKITTGIQSDKLVEVKSGLKAGDTVILSPSSDIKNNVEVTKE